MRDGANLLIVNTPVWLMSSAVERRQIRSTAVLDNLLTIFSPGIATDAAKQGLGEKVSPTPKAREPQFFREASISNSL
jgi:hypothetical protein